MKISKKTLLITSGMLSISALGLMFVSAADRELFMDVHNAIQHIDTIKIISTGNDDTTAILSNSNGLVKIKTNNFILGETGDKKNIIINNVNGSSILGGENNRIGGGYNVILGGSGNKVGGMYNTNLGGEGNNVNARTCGSYNTIIGGNNNIISGGTSATNHCINVTDQSESSVIIGGHDNNLHGRFSVIMGNNSSVKGNNSFALGSGAHIEANNSFLWTDGNYPETLKANDVFVIMAQNGAIINTNKAHSFAKLTLGGPLVLSNSNNQSDIQCGQSQGGGIIKMEKSENNQLCLCSCDGSGRNSMFSHGACSKVCNKSIEPPKCNTEVSRKCGNNSIVYSGSCKNGTVIEGTGSYFVDKNDIVHRTCQSKDGSVDFCSGSVIQENHCNNIPTPVCQNKIEIDPNGGTISFNNQSTNIKKESTKNCGETTIIGSGTRQNSDETIPCIIYLNGNGGTSNSSTQTTNITKTTSYTFGGWINQTSNGSCGTLSQTIYTHPSTNGTTCTKKATWNENTQQSTGQIILPGAQFGGYTFSGWYTSQTGGTYIGGSGDSYTPTTCGITLYAQRKKNECPAPTIKKIEGNKIYFDSNGGNYNTIFISFSQNNEQTWQDNFTSNAGNQNSPREFTPPYDNGYLKIRALCNGGSYSNSSNVMHFGLHQTIKTFYNGTLLNRVLGGIYDENGNLVTQVTKRKYENNCYNHTNQHYNWYCDYSDIAYDPTTTTITIQLKMFPEPMPMPDKRKNLYYPCTDNTRCKFDLDTTHYTNMYGLQFDGSPVTTNITTHIGSLYR